MRAVPGSVDCLTIDGDSAVVEGTLKKPIDGFDDYRLRITDRDDEEGDRGRIVLSDDLLGGDMNTARQSLQSGDFQVKDASPAS